VQHLSVCGVTCSQGQLGIVQTGARAYIRNRWGRTGKAEGRLSRKHNSGCERRPATFFAGAQVQ
jgi:hypothetical protein